MWKTTREITPAIQCSLCPATDVYIEPVGRQKIELLMEAYPNQEWFAYLVGKHNKRGFFVEDIFVPEHSYVNGSSAEAVPPVYDKKTGAYTYPHPANCIGVIHSHHTMGAFHSGTDDAYVDKNYPISICVAKRTGVATLEYDSVCFLTTPCGKATTGKATVKYVSMRPLFNTDAWLKTAKTNIEKGKRVVYQNSLTPNYLHPRGAVTDLLLYRGKDGEETVLDKDLVVVDGLVMSRADALEYKRDRNKGDYGI